MFSRSGAGERDFETQLCGDVLGAVKLETRVSPSSDIDHFPKHKDPRSFSR